MSNLRDARPHNGVTPNFSIILDPHCCRVGGGVAHRHATVGYAKVLDAILTRFLVAWGGTSC